MATGNSKLFLGLVIGAAVGVAAGAFFASDNKERLLENINDVVDKAKRKIGDAINKGIDDLDAAVDKVNAIAQSAIARAKSPQTVEE